jgi:hypothetical protein
MVVGVAAVIVTKARHRVKRFELIGPPYFTIERTAHRGGGNREGGPPWDHVSRGPR